MGRDWRAQLVCAAIACATAAALPGQAPKLEFEAASVRASDVPAGLTPLARRGMSRMTGGPGTVDPEHLTISHMPLRNLLFNAYGVRPDQISGPGWLDTEEFDVTATIAPGTTKEQGDTMLQNLLIEQFKIESHHITKEVLAYELTVAKSRSKLKQVTPSPTATRPQPGEYFDMHLDSKGFPIVKEDEAALIFNSRDGLTRITCQSCSIKDLIGRIRESVTTVEHAPAPNGVIMLTRLVDKTGLTGTYDFRLEALGSMSYIGGMLNPPPVDADGGPRPDIFAALEQQLGLKLEKTKIPIDVLVIDHIEKTPAGN